MRVFARLGFAAGRNAKALARRFVPADGEVPAMNLFLPAWKLTPCEFSRSWGAPPHNTRKAKLDDARLTKTGCWL